LPEVLMRKNLETATVVDIVAGHGHAASLRMLIGRTSGGERPTQTAWRQIRIHFSRWEITRIRFALFGRRVREVRAAAMLLFL
jgi:hypothetical protein